MHKTNLAALISIAIAGAAHAHHGIANFDLNTDIELAGVVTDVDFINPHSWLYLDVTAEDGSVTAWRCELRGSTVLRRSGWSEDMLPAGLGIRITGSPDRRDPTTCYLGTAFFPDGRLPHSDQLHVVERFSLDTGTMALSRDYVATDPLYILGEYTGNDVVLISDLPYTGTTECEDRTYVDTPAQQ